MTTIPEIRTRLIYLAQEHALPELAVLAQALKRRPMVRKARPKYRPLTPVLKEDIQAYAGRFPDLSYQEIANHFFTNIGRVSEALRGKREPSGINVQETERADAG
jgi:hypothetical protein